MLPLWDDLPRRRFPLGTLLLIAANLAVFGYEVDLALSGGRALKLFLGEYSLVPRQWMLHWDDPAAWLPVLTSMFLHGGAAHVIGNCWYLWVFGRGVEDRLGVLRFLCVYLLCGLGAAVLQVAVDSDSLVPMLGASGAISGVMGGYFVLFPGAWVYTLVPWIVPILPLPAFLLLIAWFVLQTLNGFGALVDGGAARGGVAWWAHAGGFVSGLMLLLWLRARGWVRRR